MKKFLSLILALLMLISPMSLYAEGEITTEGSDEVTPYVMKTEEKILASLEIIDPENFDGRKPVTRAEFVVSVMKLCGLGEIPPQNTNFSDIPSDATYSGAVKTATDLKIINGFGDGTFRPDTTITTEQAAKIVLSATGFDVYAASYGGYPGGYLTIAAVNGLLKRVSVGDYLECNWSDGAMILYNALTMDILQQSEFPRGEYKTIDGENPLTMWLDVKTTEGVITANEYTSLTPPSTPLSDGKFMINETQYNTGESDAPHYLGYSVKLYYKEIDSKNTAIICIPSTRTKIYEISAEDISPATTVSTLEYYDGSDILRLNISGTKLIYNGKATSLDVSKLTPSTGLLKAIDNDGNGNIDIIFSENYVSYYVDTVTPKSYSFIEKFTDTKIVFEIDNPKYDTVIFDEGEVVDFSAVKAGDVLSVMQSEDGTYTKIMIGSEKVDAAILELSDNTIMLDEGDGEYKFSDNVKPYVSSLKINDVKTFTLTFDGKIGGWGDSKTTGNYGYLITAAATGEGLSSTHQGTFRIFDANSQKIQNYNSANDIEYNGKKSDENGTKYSGKLIIEKLSDGGVIQDQLIKYVLNENGEISKFYTAQRNTAEPFVADPENFTLDYWLEYAGSKTPAGYVEASNPKIQLGDNPCRNHYYFGFYTWQDNSYGTIDGYISCKNTTMIALPVIPEGKTLMDMEKDITVVTNNWFLSDNQRLRFLYLKVYDMSESRQAQILVFRNYAGGSTGTVPAHEHVLVDRISTALDDEGYEVTKIFGYIGNNPVEYVVDSEAVSNGDITPAHLNLKRGDVIRVATAPNVIRIKKIFSVLPNDGNGEYLLYSDEFADWQMESSAQDADDYTPVKNSTTVPEAGKVGPNYEKMSIATHERIKKAFSTGFVITSDALRGPTDKFIITRSADTCYSVYDETSNTVRPGSFEDIDPDNPKQTVVMNISYHKAHEVVIYNWKEAKYPIWTGAY